MSSKEENSGMAAIIILLLVLPSAAWSGFVLTQLWAWFVTPLGVPMVTVWQAAGLFLITHWMAGAHNTGEDNRTSSEKVGASIVIMLVVPLFVWGFGAIYHAFM